VGGVLVYNDPRTRRWKSRLMSCMPLPELILELNWLVPLNDTSRHGPTLVPFSSQLNLPYPRHP